MYKKTHICIKNFTYQGLCQAIPVDNLICFLSTDTVYLFTHQIGIHLYVQLNILT